MSVGASKEQLSQTVAAFKCTHPELKVRLSAYKKISHWSAKEASDVRSSGWVVDTIEVALWGFFKYDSWAEGALAVVNLGGDSDTAGAVFGGLAGAFYGYEALPERWVNGMVNKEMIGDVAEKLAGFASA